MTADYVRELASVMSQFGYLLEMEADQITKTDLVNIAITLQANVSTLMDIAEKMPEKRIN